MTCCKYICETVKVKLGNKKYYGKIELIPKGLVLSLCCVFKAEREGKIIFDRRNRWKSCEERHCLI